MMRGGSRRNAHVQVLAKIHICSKVAVQELELDFSSLRIVDSGSLPMSCRGGDDVDPPPFTPEQLAFNPRMTLRDRSRSPVQSFLSPFEQCVSVCVARAHTIV